MNIPNAITTLRLTLIPVFVYAVLGAHNMWLAAGIFIVSGVTDVLDGYIARKYNMITKLGKLYDPLVDKLMQITAVVCLAVLDMLPIELVWFIAVKEISMVTVSFILYMKKTVVSAVWYGKAATVVFYIIIFAMLMFEDIKNNTGLFATFVVILTLSVFLSALGYLVETIKRNR